MDLRSGVLLQILTGRLFQEARVEFMLHSEYAPALPFWNAIQPFLMVFPKSEALPSKILMIQG